VVVAPKLKPVAGVLAGGPPKLKPVVAVVDAGVAVVDPNENAIVFDLLYITLL